MERGGQDYFYHADGLGSIIDLTNAAGAIVQSYVYDSFGNIVAQNGSLVNPYTYTGREFDAESGLYYYRHRYYDPALGRFLSADPIGFIGGDLNLYTYVHNSPLNRIDPLGLWYVDVNVSGGWWGGVTGGILIGKKGIYSYGGGGVVSPGVGGSLTWSPQDPSAGWNVGLQGSAVISYQQGYSFKDNSKFWEVGIGASYPTVGGISATGYYVDEPWLWPWERDWWPWKGEEEKNANRMDK